MLFIIVYVKNQTVAHIHGKDNFLHFLTFTPYLENFYIKIKRKAASFKKLNFDFHGIKVSSYFMHILLF
jgi:hypothetical protein